MKGDLNNLDVKGHKVIVRVDFNVPLDDQYNVTDDTRIRGAIPTIKYLLDKGARVILLSHFERPLKSLLPNGEIDRVKFTLNHVVPALEKLLGQKVAFFPDTIGEKVNSKVNDLQDGDILLLENTRFYAGEEKGDPVFAKQLSSLGDFYVNDAFGAAHRAHASTSVMADYFDADHKAFGFLMKSELDNAKQVLDNPKRPFIAILGGAKVSDKILLIESLLDKADKIIIGGGMAYTFIRAQGGQTGKSLVEEDKLELANQLLTKAAKLGKSIELPSDSIAADKFAADANFKNVPSNEIPEGWMGLDIGLTARFEYANHLKGAGTILWNGPMGVFEMDAFSHGTKAIAQAVADVTKTGTFSLIGGGDSVAAIHQSGLADSVSFISTGGGAMLELLEGKTLPGVAAILK
ncbi:MAG: phosphoglycerate kinase [Saprospiraceae bacterium]|uniref:Phosphoglycerate kinase n=1 Tax=Candidatus Opimibacter skivensis TaxID=2982028 RepID=A0A9D7XP62_9BACT|nr:phosphoglycerate kinase [Candidatus Opimibacter skivensis]